jgi:hypothetical protein
VKLFVVKWLRAAIQCPQVAPKHLGVHGRPGCRGSLTFSYRSPFRYLHDSSQYTAEDLEYRAIVMYRLSKKLVVEF